MENVSSGMYGPIFTSFYGLSLFYAWFDTINK